ncbi:carbohydrate sulfotransferase 12-like [Halichoeres trimaculatus]|uniref:carbohydrate sulfotransferase 12-like n=1 Tax=Halichoeres trimaculatus TaxID=147232 RepID=UPI003D9E8B2E
MRPTCGRLQLLSGFVGFMLLVVLAGHQWYMSDEKKEERIYQAQEVRRQLIREMCEHDEAAFSRGIHRFENLTYAELDNILVDDENGFIFCYIPKVACTSWRRVMVVLSRGEPYQDPVSISKGIAHNPKGIPKLRDSPEIEMKAKLKHYTKFLFVRDPFVRILSAYRDKFMGLNGVYYYFSKLIMRRYSNIPNPPETAEEAFSSHMRPSFHNFVQYLLDLNTESPLAFDPHWRPMYRLCHPCLIDYDFIGHQESFHEESMQLLSILKLGDTIKFPPSNINMTTTDTVLEWFKTVPLEDRRRLFKLYEEDFRLFGYSEPKKLLDG